MVKKIKTLSSFRKFVFKKGKKNWNLVHDDLMKLILNVIANILHNDLQVKPRLMKRMALYKREFRKLGDTSQNINIKCKFLNRYRNQKGGILPIFAALIPMLKVAAPFIAKAMLGLGTTVAGTAIGNKLSENGN